jgi:hypothetical protein
MQTVHLLCTLLVIDGFERDSRGKKKIRQRDKKTLSSTTTTMMMMMIMSEMQSSAGLGEPPCDPKQTTTSPFKNIRKSIVKVASHRIYEFVLFFILLFRNTIIGLMISHRCVSLDYSTYPFSIIAMYVQLVMYVRCLFVCLVRIFSI